MRFLEELQKASMASDNQDPLCRKSDLYEIASEFHHVYLAHKEPLIQLIVTWWEEHEKTTRPNRRPRLLPLPQRDLSLAEKAACLAAIHDHVWRGDLINPFAIDEFVIARDDVWKTVAAREFRRLTNHVSEIPFSDLDYLNDHLDSVKNAMSPGRKKERYPNRNDLWCRWFDGNGLTDAEIRDRWNEMPDEERKAVDPRGWHQISEGPAGPNAVQGIRKKRGIKRRTTNDE